MKKILALFFVLIFLLAGSIYLFIPKQVEIRNSYFLKGNAAATLRVLSDTASWGEWWPDELNKNKNIMEPGYYKDMGFRFLYAYSNGVTIEITEDSEKTKSDLTVIPVNIDSILLIWKCDLAESEHPIKRVQNYFKAKIIWNNMTAILNSLDNFLQKDENMYGFRFDIIMSQDSTLVMTKRRTDSYPSEKYIYDLIRELQIYIRDEGALEINYPMLNVKKINDHQFETSVAIPVNKELPGKGTIFFSRFVPWKVLAAEVKGGVTKVEEALYQMDLYISDHNLTKMAVPFQSLVTNRIEQPDSTLWITRIYTPVP